MIRTKRNVDRGHSQYSWLDSWHTFSFGDYYDPGNQGVSVMRVINEDTVIPGAGFETHAHRDMEIISYVLEGTLEHKDSMGNITLLEAGEIQVITAGAGITHSEFNPSSVDLLRFLQIWIRPDKTGLTPAYRQSCFPLVRGRHLIVSPDGARESLRINQDATIERIRLAAGNEIEVTFQADRRGYLYMVRGSMELDDTTMNGGDGASISLASISLRGTDDAEVLLFSLP